MNFAQALEKIKEGWVVSRTTWACKVIRRWRDSDADFFMSEFDHTGAIIQECNQSCDCKIGIWVQEEGDKEADNWFLLHHDK